MSQARTSDGLTFHARPKEPQAPLPELILSGALLCVLMGMLAAMAGLRSPVIPMAVGLAVLAAQAVFARHRRVAAAVLPLCAAVAAALWGGVLLDGLRLLGNGLFEASAGRNAYEYQLFAVTVPESAYSGCILAALILVACALAVFSRWAVSQSGAAPVGLTFLGLALAQAYFGVTAGGWNLALLAVWVLCLGKGMAFCPKGVALVLILMVLIALPMGLMLPGEHQALSAWAESVRDALGDPSGSNPFTLWQAPNAPWEARREQRLALEGAEMTDDAAGFRPLQREQNEVRQQSPPEEESGPPLLWTLIQIVLLLTVPFVPFIWDATRRRKLAEREQAFSSPDTAAAVQSIFSCLVAWLELAGLERHNRTYSACQEAVLGLLGADHAEGYGDTVALWQEAVYSEHRISDAARDKGRAFLAQASKAVWEKSTRWTRFKIRYIRFLY